MLFAVCGCVGCTVFSILAFSVQWHLESTAGEHGHYCEDELVEVCV